jgi:hypothetical protein
MTGEPILPARTADQYLARYWWTIGPRFAPVKLVHRSCDLLVDNWSAVRAGKIGSPVMRFIIAHPSTLAKRTPIPHSPPTHPPIPSPSNSNCATVGGAGIASVVANSRFFHAAGRRKESGAATPTRWVAGRLYLSILPAGTRDTLTETHTHGFGLVAICGIQRYFGGRG